ncbi:carbon-nitrogen hydrolase family protein [Azospira sp. APE16]|jgi:predicted amidohydrolase|uniref:Putative amidohydrolase n=1 Tax=Azospira oryzae (strain ATCC BAA-33 / DSM 13638 / PS) TaxID=640081 RepID=G8QKJ3_AZOOP|nr:MULTISPECIES: carbon-nitrogen hydrolase family protein [Azospira]AEV27732.1 putative amidohydrolase [Azospira oryzae PS]MDK9689623.1 carbon-nitrogen hydrolase family protein [Azospira sp.]BBN88440.1 hydrolase [Azospira sp. I09]
MNPPSPERQKTENALIAAVQLVSGPRVADNLAAAAHGVAEAAAQGARIVALPEYFPIMGMAEGDKVKVREADGHGPIQEFLAATAKQHGIWLIGGSIPLEAKDAAKVMNSTVVYDPAGQRVARYDKIHLFGFQKGLERYDEAASIEAGSEPVAFDTPYGRIGLSICYDLRFPELYRRLAPVDLIVVPAAFTETTGRAHWEILLRARAIENQCYVLAVGQGGKHENGRETHGNSMIVDPWGTIVDRKLKGPGVVLGLLDHGCIAETRANLPALKHRVL